MRSAYSILMILTIAGCAAITSWESRYLASAQDHATQADVRASLGAPQAVASNASGERWTYDRYSLEPGAQSTWSASGSQCDQYTLQFDSTGVLRQWDHRNYRHGGETMPRECVSPTEHWRRSDVSAGYHY